MKTIAIARLRGKGKTACLLNMSAPFAGAAMALLGSLINWTDAGLIAALFLSTAALIIAHEALDVEDPTTKPLLMAVAFSAVGMLTTSLTLLLIRPNFPDLWGDLMGRLMFLVPCALTFLVSLYFLAVAVMQSIKPEWCRWVLIVPPVAGLLTWSVTLVDVIKAV